MKWHPDKNTDNKQLAEEKFKDIGEAYEVLKDKNKRALYDQYGDDGLRNPNAGFHTSDPYSLFREFFGNSPFGGFGDSTFGQPFGGSPFGQPFGGSPFGQPFGGSPFVQQPFGGSPFGQQSFGGSPFGGSPFGSSPFGQQSFGGSPFSQSFSQSSFGSGVSTSSSTSSFTSNGSTTVTREERRGDQVIRTVEKDGKLIEKTINGVRQDLLLDQTPQTSQTRQSTQTRQTVTTQSTQEAQQEWGCECTFLNPPNVQKCQMCNKSKTSWSCQFCTYKFNKSQSQTCKMCGNLRS